jgi:hypothetical protein
VLCGATAILSASNGYNSYSWSTSSTEPKYKSNLYCNLNLLRYHYYNHASKEEINLILTITNPERPTADQIVTCPNNGKDLPNIFLCGATAKRLIETNIRCIFNRVAKLNEATVRLRLLLIVPMKILPIRVGIQ